MPDAPLEVRRLEESEMDRIFDERGRMWHEGVGMVGFWPRGDSFLLRARDRSIICLSRKFVVDLIAGCP